MLVNRMVPFGGTPARVERIVTGAVGLESATSLRERQTFYLVPVSLCHNCVLEPYPQSPRINVTKVECYSRAAS